jgi:hypothetical protein
MNTVEETVEACLSKMKKGIEYSWETWCVRFAKDKEPPRPKTWAFRQWQTRRVQRVRRANKVLANLGRAERLVASPDGSGVTLLDEKEVAHYMADLRTRKIVQCLKLASSETLILAESPALSEANKNMLTRTGSIAERELNAAIGSFVQMKSLPLKTRNWIKKNYVK